MAFKYKTTRTHYNHMRFPFPFKFRGFQARDTLNTDLMTRAIRLIPLRRVDQYLGTGSLAAFGTIYTNVLQAMADYDYDYLSNIMEPKLYKAFRERLQDFQSKNYYLEYIEQNLENSEDTEVPEQEGDAQETEGKGQEKVDRFRGEKGILSGPMAYIYEERDMQIFMEAKGSFGVHINRAKNTGHYRKFGGRFTSMSFYKAENVSWSEMIRRQVLVLDVYYYTSRKLVLKDEDGDVLEGSEDAKELFDHKFRFETYSDKIDWVLSDIDGHLAGNPYFEDPNKESASSATKE